MVLRTTGRPRIECVVSDVVAAVDAATTGSYLEIEVP